MRILQIHNSYKQAGGEDIVVEEEARLLIAKGNEVHQVIKSNDEIGSLKSKIDLLFSTHYNHAASREIKQILRDIKPDIVHVHNFFPLFSPSIFDAINHEGVPSILTLHNYRLIHPNGLLLHRGKIDERGLVSSAYGCIKDKVYRDSYIQTTVVAHMIEHHRRKGTWDKVTRFIALSSFAKSKFVEWGLPQERISIKPNFIGKEHSREPLPFNQRKDFVYIGRVSEEKGIAQLVNYWRENQTQTLHIIGEGPLDVDLMNQTSAAPNIIWHGKQSRSDTIKYLRKSKALIFPSICYENFPMTILEAFGNGIPVLTNSIGSHGAIVEHQTNGLHFDLNDTETISKAISLAADPSVNERLSTQAYEDYNLQFSSEKNHDRMLSIYMNAIESKASAH
ncbi:MAG: glycosyltransferase family 4 protein [Cyclobacteriaceae bacterium]